LPGYLPVTTPGVFASEYAGLPKVPGLTQSAMLAAAAKGELGALLVMGANPALKSAENVEALKNTFLVVADIFLTETAALANVVLPAATLYEKTGTVTNTFGDVQQIEKAADRPGVKSDFEILVRLAGAMGVDVKTLVPFGGGSVSADLGQSRGAQAGEADRHAVYLQARGLEPKTSPFDPLATLDEIERLVPGYKLDRTNLLSGNAVVTDPGLVPVSAIKGATQEIAPAHDGLFTSALLGRHSPLLRDLELHQAPKLVDSAK
jgi:NADH-quinone oxidoreductase subunit G